MAAVATPLPGAIQRRRRRDRTRWGPDRPDDDTEAVEDGAEHCTEAAGQTINAEPFSAPEASAPQPKRPKRSRWASQEADVTAVVPGLPVPVSLPASLAGLVDANPQAMLLHRQLGTVRCVIWHQRCS